MDEHQHEVQQLELDNKRKQIADADAMRDAQRKMAWFALFGMLLYPFAVILADYAGLHTAITILGSMAGTYFVSVSAIVSVFFGSQTPYFQKK